MSSLEVISLSSQEYALPHFSCQESTFTHYSQSKIFEDFLNCKGKIQTKDSSLEKFLPFTLVKDVPTFICDIKKNFYILNTLSKKVHKDNLSIDIKSIRSHVSELFYFLLYELQAITSESDFSSSDVCTFIVTLKQELHHLLIAVGPISKIMFRNIHMYDANDKIGCKYHYSHMCLDIWLNSLFVFDVLTCTGIEISELLCLDVGESDSLSQITAVLIFDLIIVSQKNYKKTEGIFNESPYTCICFQDLWLAVMKLLSKNVNSIESKPAYDFWSRYHKAILLLLKRNKNGYIYNSDQTVNALVLTDSELDILDITESCLWLTSHLVILFGQNISNHDSNFKSCFAVIHSLLQTTYQKGYRKELERQFRSVLYHCFKITSFQGLSTDEILLLTEFYIKCIEETFCPRTNQLTIEYLFTSSKSWLDYIENLASSKEISENESSFTIFLKILTTQLKKEQNENFFKVIQGRICSKFAPRKVREMSEVGLQNTFSLFLALVASGNNHINDKICDLAAMIGKIKPKRQGISWRALFVLFQLSRRRKLCTDSLIKKLCELFEIACKEFIVISQDSMLKKNMMDLLLIYIDNVVELFEDNPGLENNEYKLIVPSFGNILSHCGIGMVNNVIYDLLKIITSIYISFDDAHASEILDFTVSPLCERFTECLILLTKYVLPAIKEKSLSNTPPPLIADIAASLTGFMCKLSFSETETKTNPQSVFLFFSSNEEVNISIVCQFLNFLFDDKFTLAYLKEKVPDFDIIVFQSWLNCVIFLKPPCEEMKKLTPKVLHESHLVDYFSNIKEISCATEHDYFAIKLFRVMGETFDNTVTLSVKHELKLLTHNYFKSYVLTVSRRLKNDCNKECMAYVFRLTSHLVEYCAPLLYFSFNPDCLLPQLIDNVTNPLIVFPRDKQAQSMLCYAIKDYLPSFIKGLFKVGQSTVSKIIKDVVVNFIYVYSPVNNPFTTICIDSLNSRPEGLKMHDLNFLLDIIKMHVLTNNNINGFEVCYEIFRLSPSARKPIIASILLKSGMAIYMNCNDSCSEQIRQIIFKVVLYYKNTEFDTAKEVIIPAFEWLFNEKLQWASLRGFELINQCARQFPEIALELIPFLTKAVENIEKNRGSGVDSTLRMFLKNTLTILKGNK